MHTTANVIQNIQPSITSFEFLGNLMMNEEDQEMLLHGTLRRILAEIHAIENSESGSLPDFDQEVKLIQELCTYGYIRETHEALTGMGNHINELFSHLMPWYRMQTKMFRTYTLPNHLRSQGERPLDGQDIFLESVTEDAGIASFLWTWLGTEDNEDCVWRESRVAIYDLIEFAVEKGMCEAVSDSVGHDGRHLQREEKIPAYIYVQEHIEHIIKSYVKAGREIVTL